MSEPFIAEIRIFAGNFEPRGWAFCNGQLLPIAQNTALFSLIGTTYGGDGRTTTALPNLQGRAPMHPGQGPGLTSRQLGESGGRETVVLLENQLPVHNHQMYVNGAAVGDSNLPGDKFFANSSVPPASVYSNDVPDLQVPLITGESNSQPHNNMQPHLTMNFIIALVGLYPSRS
ncbi:Microcystin-dependent protein [Mariniphaga anaerophila]|uniref:Microcystin-dependent protein n=1 Tax=Mariniphaga anaerophila TaxID=1484053 RepID=A0A1M5ETA2_9BACT|nr:tail fiber protein [Mariniphaga anaerophila]SHF82242.1 Microcystin-dependent protein [Mariniphaga anaerophila]